MTLPKWLKERIGEPTRGRGCRAVKCIKCKADVLAGPNEDQMAMPAIVDPIPLDTVGEALAQVDDRQTYELRRHGQGLALWLRTHWDIEGKPASDEHIVLADHKCGAAKLPAVEIKPLATGATGKGLPYDAEPTF